MTNKEAKQEAIKNAYGSQYTELKPDSLGRIDFFSFRKNKEKYLNIVQLDADGKYWRPKSLSGIEDNNGWTRIEPDGSNLPKEAGIYKVICIGYEKPFDLEFHLEYDWIANFNRVEGVTHYKPIKEEPLPVY